MIYLPKVQIKKRRKDFQVPNGGLHEDPGLDPWVQLDTPLPILIITDPLMVEEEGVLVDSLEVLVAFSISIRGQKGDPEDLLENLLLWKCP